MQRILALDLGTKRTGVAFFDAQVGIPLPLATITASGDEDLVQQITTLARERRAEHLLVGLPLLLSGAEGSQVLWVRKIVDALTNAGFVVSLLDERFTSPAGHNDPDAIAALEMLQTAIKRGI